MNRDLHARLCESSICYLVWLRERTEKNQNELENPKSKNQNLDNRWSLRVLIRILSLRERSLRRVGEVGKWRELGLK